MIKSYFKIGIRNIKKYKVFSFINIFGLAVAMASCMLILLMLSDQSRYDAFHIKKDRIYRLLTDGSGFRMAYATTPFPLSTALTSEYPIVEQTTRLTPSIGGDAAYNQHFQEMRGYFAEPSFFEVFSFDLEKGNSKTALTAPRSMVINTEMAALLFKSEDPIGKTIDFADRQLAFPQPHDGIGSPPVSWGAFTITGVIDEKKYISHLKFDVLVSASTMGSLYSEKKIEDMTNNWEWYFRTYTYAMLREGKTQEDLSLALGDLAARKYANIKSEQTKGIKFDSQKLSEIQLNLKGNDTNNRLPLIGYYFLSLLALVIMVSACLNYTNLSVARALTRAREIGVRKVTGANRSSLIFQFLSESVITTLLALVMAMAMLVFFIRPAFKGLWINKHLNFELPDSLSIYLIFIGFAILIGIIAGFYPAFYLSKYQPIQALRNAVSLRPGKLGMRKILSVTQFVISMLFITTSILIYNQFRHFVQFDYGFDSKNVVNVELQGADYRKLAHEFNSVAGISAVSATDIIPGTERNNGIELRKPTGMEEYVRAGVLAIDDKFTEALDLKLIAGKGLPPWGEGSDHFVLVNEATAKKMGYKYPAEIVGQTFEMKWGKTQLEVIGVVRDFRYKMLLNEDQIGPLVMRSQAGGFEYLNVKIVSHDLIATVAKLEEKWKLIDPIHPFKYEFFDDQLATMHKGIFDVVSILGFIAFLAVIIACLGLLGMAMYTTERRTKEVGIRKVLGAGVFNITLLLSREFLRMLAISICISAPLSYFLNNFWLQKFPNRVEFGFGTVFSGMMILLTLGLLTVGSQTILASRRNPVDSLKTD